MTPVPPVPIPRVSKSTASSLRRLRMTTVLLVASFAVLVIAAGAYNLMQQYRVVMNASARTARNTEKAIEAHASQTFGETFRMMEGIADVYKHEMEHEGLQKRGIDERYLHELIAEKLTGAPWVASFFILDENYRGVAGSRFYPVNMSRIYLTGISFEDVVDVGENLIVGRLFRNVSPAAPAETWLLPVGVKVKDKDGNLQGFVFSLLRPRYFSDYYATLDVGPHGRIALWDADHRLIAATPEQSAIGAVSTEAWARAGADPVDQNDDAVYTVGAGLAEQIVARAKMPHLPFSVSVVLDSQDYLMSWRNARNVVTLAVIGIILAMSVFGFIILRQFRRTEENEKALRQAKAAAEEANDAKSRFLAHMSHEFRTPLNAIMGFSEIIKNKVLGESIAPAYTSYADHIHRSGEHLLHIVNDILDMAKVESGAQHLQREALNVPDIIAAAVSFVEGMAGQKLVKMRMTVPPGLPLMMADQRFTRQVVINLLTNAIKFSPPHKDVVISAVYTPKAFLEVSVSDQGPGIGAALLKRLGEPFLQGNPTITHSGQGTGLGLSICKRYMDLLGGELKIDSVVGSGTTATIRFPQRLLVAAKDDAPSPSRSVA